MNARFNEDLDEMKFDLGLPSSASSAEVHEACRTNIKVWSVTEASRLMSEAMQVSDRCFALPGCHNGNLLGESRCCREVLLSRWFHWHAAFSKFGKAWTFLRKVHTFRQTLQRQTGPQDMRPRAAGSSLSCALVVAARKEPGAESDRVTLSSTPEGIKADMLQKLADLQSRKSYLDVTADVLREPLVKDLGWQRLV